MAIGEATATTRLDRALVLGRAFAHRSASVATSISHAFSCEENVCANVRLLGIDVTMCEFLKIH